MLEDIHNTWALMGGGHLQSHQANHTAVDFTDELTICNKHPLVIVATSNSNLTKPNELI